MTVTTFWLSLGILTLVFLIMLLIFYTLYRREIKVKTESTAKVLGEVVAFDSKNQLLISLPVVEYQVEGERYQKTFTYANFRETSSKSRQTNVFDRTYVLGAGKNLDLRMIFPIGFPMTVFYNPVDPQIGFVERYAGLVGFYKIGMTLTVGIYLGLVCILALLG
ncbi:DUF3592 domain-containing protein [Streptococcus sp. HCA-5024]|uniref:DUF3592 domain-containing protein n=1 Tax=Streptococcus sp. HCA-5024 TaxID=3134665 RepID=UPI0030BADF38